MITVAQAVIDGGVAERFDASAYFREERERKERELPWASTMFQARRGGRVLTRYWNRHLQKPVGIRATQLEVLAAVKISHNAKTAAIADRLGLAHCTLSRSLARLQRNGLVERIVGNGDRRQRWSKLTKAGERVLEEGRKAVEKRPQPYMRTRLGAEMCKRIRTDSEKIASATRAQTQEEKLVYAGIPFWDLAYYEKKWSGVTEEEMVRNAHQRNTAGKPPPKNEKP